MNVWQGGRDVLRLYGYTEERPDGLSFPEDQEEPDEHQVATVTLEVVLLRTELSLLLQVRCTSSPAVLSMKQKSSLTQPLLKRPMLLNRWSSPSQQSGSCWYCSSPCVC